MAKRIRDLPKATSVGMNDALLIDQDGVAKQVTDQALFDLAGPQAQELKNQIDQRVEKTELGSISEDTLNQLWSTD